MITVIVIDLVVKSAPRSLRCKVTGTSQLLRFCVVTITMVIDSTEQEAQLTCNYPPTVS